MEGGDGISLMSAAHPTSPWYRRLLFWFYQPGLSEDSLETIEIQIEEETLLIIPTIGRVVLVHRPDSGSDQPERGDICYVHNPWSINVSGNTKDGDPFKLVEVPLEHDESSADRTKPFCYWMPYQKQAAQRHEQESASAADSG